jgi:hypothetical protein
LTSALAGGGQLHAPAALPQGKSPRAHCIRGWVGPSAGLDDLKERKFLPLPGLELRSLGRRARSESLNRLRYPGSWFQTVQVLILPITVSVSSAEVIFTKNAYLQELPETCILYYFSIGRYEWMINMRSGVPCYFIKSVGRIEVDRF